MAANQNYILHLYIHIEDGLSKQTTQEFLFFIFTIKAYKYLNNNLCTVYQSVEVQVYKQYVQYWSQKQYKCAIEENHCCDKI